MSRKWYLAVMAVMVVTTSFAQSGGPNSINVAANMVRDYFDPLVKLVYAIGAVVGLIGAVRTYQKFSSGDPDTGKTAASWFGACIFLVICATVLRSFFF